MLVADLVASLRASTPLGRISADSGRLVFEVLLSLGYRIVPPGTPGRYLESDEDRHGLIQHLRSESPLGSLSYPESQAVFSGLWYRIVEPTTHPSGVRTSEKPFTKVKRLGAGSSYAVVDKTGTPEIASTFNGGEAR